MPTNISAWSFNNTTNTLKMRNANEKWNLLASPLLKDSVSVGSLIMKTNNFNNTNPYAAQMSKLPQHSPMSSNYKPQMCFK